MNIRSIHKKEFISFSFFVIIRIGDDKMDCLFCKIINGDIPSYTIYENNYENYDFCYISASKGRFPWGSDVC